MTFAWKGALALVIMLVFPIGPAAGLRAQGPVRLAGSVRTSQAIPVPAATVRAENLASHQAWVSWTDNTGKYQFPALPPGQYRVEASMLGFTAAASEVDLSGAAASLDLILQVATLAELSSPTPAPRVAAAAAGNAPRPVAPEVGAAPGGRRSQPGHGPAPVPAGVMNAIRSGMGGFQQVGITDQAGTEDEASAQTVGQAASPAAQLAATMPLGEASSSDAFLMNGSVGLGAQTLPGAGMMAGGPGMGGPGLPGQGIGLSGAGPEGGRPGAVMIVGGGGGPGRFRGRPGGPGGFAGPGGPGGIAGLYIRQRLLRRQVNRIRFNITDLYENSVWDGLPYSLGGAAVPYISHYNERLGASMGGPLYLPHLYDGRDRTFFFVNYNLNRQQSPINSYSTVPTLPERSGNFCARNSRLFDPYSNLAGPRASWGCQIPPGMLNSAATGLLQFIPQPNLPGLVDNFHLETTVPQASDFVNVHVLHTISSKLSVNAGYNFRSTRANTLTNFPALAGQSLIRNQNVTLGLTQDLSPRLVHVDSLNFNRSRVQTLSDHSFGPDIAGELGITGVSTSPVDFGIPQISFTNFTGLTDPIPLNNRNQTWRFDDSFTYSRTSHTFTAGFETRRIDWNKLGNPVPRGAFTFTGLMTSQLDAQGQPVAGTGLDLADFLLSLPESTNTQFGSTASYFRSWGFAGYAQDDWRAAPRFSFEYGLRYDFVTPPVELYNAIANLLLNSTITAVTVATPGEQGQPRSLLHNDPHDWGPRVGIAWQPLHNNPIIVRGGYSIFYNTSIYQQLSFDMANQPPFAQAQIRLTAPNQLLMLENGFPPAPLPLAENTVAVDPSYRTPYAQIWDLSIERQFRGAWVFNIYYTGTRGTHLDLARAPNRAPPGSPLNTANALRIPGASNFVYDTFGASSIYNAVHLTLRKRPTHGVMVLADYAYGKSIDDASTIGGGAPVVVQNDNDFSAERGLSSFDIRQQFRSFFFYQLPFGPRQRWARGGWTERLFGDYRLNGVLVMNSGTPLTARVLGAQSDNTGTGANFSQRADQVSSGCGGPGATAEFFNTAAFVLPPAGQYGDAARNTICGPGLFNLNLSLDRSFVFGSDRTRRLDLRWDVSNVTNTPHWTGVNAVVNSATYGYVTGVGTMRTMQLSIRVSF